MNYELFCSSVQALFEGRATPLQRELIEKAMHQPEYRELYFTLLEAWESQNPQLIVDTESAFQQWRSHILSSPDLPLKRTTIKPAYRQLLPIWAAAMVVLLAAGVFFRDQIFTRTYSTSYGELKTVYLNDGTRVTMNANSKLTLPRFGFGNKVRNVYLDGEAEFAVSHLKDAKPFMVYTPDNLEVKVLGTEFIVYSRKKGSKVALSKGKVQLRVENVEQPLVMEPGDVVTVSSEGEVIREQNQPVEVHTAWKFHRFTFDNTRISTIADQLHDVFGVNVIIADSALAKRTIGGTFQADSAEKVLQILADILEVRVIPGPVSEQLPRTYTLTY